MHIFYFIKYFDPGFQPYWIKIRDMNSVFIFDLEDSIMKVNNQQATNSLKVKYRKILSRILLDSDEFKKYNLAIRLNQLDSSYYEEDIDLLKRIGSLRWHTIILPKMESKAQLDKALQDLKNASVQFENLGILIETNAGIEFIRKLKISNYKSLKYVLFGHADFNLDNDLFPFYNQDTELYWTWIDKFKFLISQPDIVFINPPILQLNRLDILGYSLKRISQIFGDKFGQITLTKRQTDFCQGFSLGDKYPLTLSGIYEGDYKVLASNLVERGYGNPSDKSFVLDPIEQYISPQELILAQRYLDKTER